MSELRAAWTASKLEASISAMNLLPEMRDGPNIADDFGSTSVMDDINSAARRFFVQNDGELRGNGEDFLNGSNGVHQIFMASDSSDSLQDGVGFDHLDISSQDLGTSSGRKGQDSSMVEMFRNMRNEIMRLQRENRGLTRQLSIAQHQLRSVFCPFFVSNFFHIVFLNICRLTTFLFREHRCIVSVL